VLNHRHGNAVESGRRVRVTGHAPLRDCVTVNGQAGKIKPVTCREMVEVTEACGAAAPSGPPRAGLPVWRPTEFLLRKAPGPARPNKFGRGTRELLCAPGATPKRPLGRVRSTGH